MRWIPSGRPGHRDAPVADGRHRLAMLELALEGRPQFTIDPAELRAGSPTFTINTLTRERAAQGPAAPLVFLVGADQLMALDGWRDWQRLLDLAHFGVAERPGHPIEPSAMPAALAREYAARQAGPDELASRPAGHISVFPIRPLDVSSSAVRAAVAAGRLPGDQVPCQVLDYIESNRLYLSRTAPR